MIELYYLLDKSTYLLQHHFVILSFVFILLHHRNVVQILELGFKTGMNREKGERLVRKENALIVQC